MTVYIFFTATRSYPKAQGRGLPRTLGWQCVEPFTLKALHKVMPQTFCVTPSAYRLHLPVIPGCATSSRPWASEFNHFVVRTHRGLSTHHGLSWNALIAACHCRLEVSHRANRAKS